MIHVTDAQWERIRRFFPEENIPVNRRGRKPIPARSILDAVLWILTTGAQWKWLPECYPNYKTVHRRYQKWCRNRVLADALVGLVKELRESGVIDESECFVDGMFLSAKGGGRGVGWTKRGKGVRVMGIVDRHGLPLSVSTHGANHHETKCIQLTLDFYPEGGKPENLVGDEAYDSGALDDDLRAKRST